MWHWITCLVTGHEYSVSCDHGRMFLKCLVCGRRSEGWVVHKDTESLIANR
jgi:transcription elongation factor Elf1